MIRIFLADDHAVVREGLRSLINAQQDMSVTGEAINGAEALELLQHQTVDVMIVDVAMPEISGIEVTARVRQSFPNIKVLALSAYDDVSYLRELLRAGAVGYVLKRSAAETLIQAIRTVVGGGIYLDVQLTEQLSGEGIQTLLEAQQTQINGLSTREEEVLQLIAQGFANKEAAAQLHISVKSVETYKARAMEKLGLRSRVELIRYAVQHGWLSG